MNGLVQRAVDIAGGQTQLARLIGVKQGHVWKWLRMQRVPAERAIQIEVATNGAVTARELRPDLAAMFGAAEPVEKPVGMTKAKAIELFGSVSALAQALDVTRQAVSQWPDGEIDEPRNSQITLLAIRRGLIPPIEPAETRSTEAA